jgi:hypothetical protein
VLAWHWSAGWEAVQVERATAAAGPYAVLAVVRREAAPEYVDALPGIETAWYRLRALPSAATSAPFMVEAAVGNSRLRFARERAGLLVIGMSLVAPASRLAIHDVLGREVASLPVHGLGRGDHVLEWEPRTRDGARLARGVYWARLEAGGVVTSLRFLRLQP